MRKAIAVILGLPASVAASLAPLARRPVALRMTALAAIVVLLTFAALGGAATTITAYKTAPADPHAAARMAATVTTDFGVHEAVTIDFSSPMDAASVEAALTIVPAAAHALRWSDDGRSLRITPTGAWDSGKFYTITVGTAAVDTTGKPLAAPVRAVFFTRDRAAAEISLTRMVGKFARPDTAVALRFSSPVDPASVAAALSVEPAVPGRLVAASEPDEVGAERFTWVPDEPFAPGATLRVTLSATVRDADGTLIELAVRLEARVTSRPTVIRSRPSAGDTAVDRDQTLSIRFSEPMDRRTTRAALRVAGLDPARDGGFRWAENDRVLIFDHSKAFPYSAKVTMSVLGSAQSKAGVSLGEPDAVAYTATFTVVKKPAAAPATRTKTTPPPTRRGSGGSASATWLAVEKYYLGLLNCTRTGGWVQSDGSCKGYGSGNYSTYVKPLSLSSGISSKVSRPYAKLLATRDICSHYADGGPDDRLRRAGYSSYRWGENIGCRSGNPYSAVLASHLFFQSEKSSGGGHWTNIKDSRFSTVGVGVWVSSGRVRLVTDFYHP